MLAAWVRTANRCGDATAQQVKQVRPGPSRLLDVALGGHVERLDLRRSRCAAAFHVGRRCISLLLAHGCPFSCLTVSSITSCNGRLAASRAL